jgi:hypothetical protein
MNPTGLKTQPAIHLQSKPRYFRVQIQVYFANVLWVAFSTLQDLKISKWYCAQCY